MGSALAITGLVQLLACVAFASTARLLRARLSHSEDATAARGFASWWSGMAVYMGVSGSIAILASLGIYSLEMSIFARFLVIPFITLAAGGLTYYVVYLYTGTRSWLVPVACYFLLAGASYMLVVGYTRPTSIRLTEWSVDLSPRPVGLDIIFILFGIPPILSALGYLSLAARKIPALQRYRIILVASSILAWVVSGIITNVLQDPVGIFIGITFCGLVTSGAVMLAYRPPRRLRLILDPRGRDGQLARREIEERRATMTERVIHLI